MGKKIEKLIFPTQGVQIDQIVAALQGLGLKAVSSHFEQIADKILEEHGTIYDCFEQLLRLEYDYREDDRVNRWISKAKLRSILPLDSYPYKQQPSVDPVIIKELASCRYIEKGKSVLFVGGPGVGKTSLATGLAFEAIQKGIETRVIRYNEFDEAIRRSADTSVSLLLRSLMAPKLLIFDDIDYFNTDEVSGTFLFNVIRQRYDKDPSLSIIVTTNSSPEDWDDGLFGTAKNKGVVVDRLLDHQKTILFNIDGPSLRVPKPPTPSTAKSLSLDIPIAHERGILKRIGASFSHKA